MYQKQIMNMQQETIFEHINKSNTQMTWTLNNTN